MSDELPRLEKPSSATPDPAKKRRGRPPGSKNKKSVIPSEAKAKTVERNDSLQTRNITDEEVGRTFSGVFLVSSVPFGPHWRLFPHEETEYGRCFGPIFRRYPEMVAKWMDLLMCGPVIASTVIPRVKVEQFIYEGRVPRGEGRDALRAILSILEQEKKSNAESLAEEGKKYQEQLAAIHAAQAEPKKENVSAIPGLEQTS